MAYKKQRLSTYGITTIIVVFFLAIILCVSCNKSKDAYTTSNKTALWLSADTNYVNKKKYQAVFYKEYNNQIINKKYDNAKWLLYNYGNLLLEKDTYDTIYFKTNVNFLKENYPIKKDTITNWLYYFLAKHSVMQSNYDDGKFWAQKIIKNSPNKNTDVFVNANMILGYSYSLTNKYDKAIACFIKLIPNAEKKKDYQQLGSLYSNIAYSYEGVYANNESKKNYEKSAFYFLKAKDTSNYFALQATFAINHFNISKDTVQTIHFIDSVFTVFNKFKKPLELDVCNANFTKAFKYYLLKDYDKALSYLNESSAFYIKTNNLDFLRYNQYLEISIKFHKTKQLENVEKIVSLAEYLSAQEGYIESIDLYTILYENENNKHNYKNALMYKNQASELKKKLFDQNQNGQLFEIEKKYLSEKKEKIIAQKNTELAKNKLYLILAIVSIFAILFATLLFFVRRKKKEIVERNKRQEQFTFQLLQNTEEERSRIANELHDSVNHDLLNIKNTIINGKDIEINTIENVIEEVRSISRNLHPAVLQNLGFEASIESLCERLTNEAGLFVTCDIDYQKKLSKSKELQLYRIIQEALNNTLKHGKANAAKVIINSTENNLTLEIKDNGNGFNVDEQLKSSASFGLQSMLQRAKAIAAKINIESSIKGTRIFINIPI